MKKVLVFGTFDGLHEGHMKFLEQARRHGDYIIGVVARDSNVAKTKGSRPMNGERSRLGALRRHVDSAILGERKVTYGLIRKLRPDVICIGYDQKPTMTEARKILKKIGMDRVELRKMGPYRPRVYKSSILNKPG
ncbi:MAG: adenylyltransferase/cytidyltransferase family protein [Candidatus Aenigmarchaeota archaeon]|nr:adenylyltransferase/cytidyltransferase family protein [Candidatus Aenigmarchaeota archaeon]